MVAAAHISNKLGISVQSVVLAATYLVLFRLKGRSSATFALMAGNRFNKRWKSLVTSMNQFAPLTISASPNDRIDDFLRNLHAASLQAYLHGCYSVDDLRGKLNERSYPDPDPMNFDCYFNFMGQDDGPPDGDSPVATTIEWQEPERRTGPQFNLFVSAGEGINLVLRASHTYLSPDMVGVFLASLEAAIVSMANDSPSKVGAISMRPIRPLSPRRSQ
jgi:hypothetical protein